VEIVDLSRPIVNGMHAHVTTSIVPVMRIGDAAGKFDAPCEGFASNLIVMSDHCGTHFDAPNHFIRGGRSVEQIPPSRTIGRAVVCDLTDVEGDQVEAEHLEAAMARTPVQPARGAFLLLHTRRPDARGKGLGRSAAEHLVARGVRLVGTDHGGIDNTRNRDRPGHMMLLQHDVLIVEGLTNLDRLVGQEVLFVCLPLALQGASGSPVRPIAIVPCPAGDWSTTDEP
jgi:kynurenine formamidase